MGETAVLTYQVTNLPSEGVTLKGSVPLAAVDIDADDRFSYPQPLFYELKLTPLGPDVLVTGKLHAVIGCVCDRCDGIGDLAVRPLSGKQSLMPLWHDITRSEVLEFCADIADLVGCHTGISTYDEIAEDIAALLEG